MGDIVMHQLISFLTVLSLLLGSGVVNADDRG